MSLEMAHLQIVGLKTDLLATVCTLRRLGCVHIDKLSESPETLLPPLTIDPAATRAHEELRLQLMQVEGILDIFETSETDLPDNEADSLTDALDGIAALIPRVQALTVRRDKLQAEQELLPRFEETIRKFLPILPTAAHAAAHDPNYVVFGLLVSRTHAGILDIISRHVVELTGGCAETAIGDVDETTRAMLIAAPREFADEIGVLLDRQDVSRLRLPSAFDSESPDTAIASVRRRLNAILDERANVERELKQITDQWSSKLLLWREILRDELDTYEVLSRLRETEMVFMLVGWAPLKEVEQLKAALSEEVGEGVLVNELPLTEETKKRAPVVLVNPRPARPFEGLVNLISVPQYGSIDPTRLMALFMPIFFGMMLGDAGYGVLLLIMTLCLRNRFKAGMLRDLVAVLAIGSGWSIVFGILFGEVFGTLGEELGLHPLLFERADPAHLLDLLALSVSIGAVHILFGLLLGVWESIKEKSRHHLLERGGRLLGLVALFLLVGVLVDFLPAGFMTPAIAVLVVGIVLLAASLGKVGIVVAPIEMIGLVGNVLSYLRIAAIGLASVYLALVANEVAGVVGSIVVGVIIAVLLHAANIVVGAFSPTIQSLRLHYVEFFRNFYEGGGRPYEPFKSRLPSSN